jgi:hypothetical protein
VRDFWFERPRIRASVLLANDQSSNISLVLQPLERASQQLPYPGKKKV